MVWNTSTMHAQNWKGTISLVSGQASASRNDMLTHGELSARNALRKLGNYMRGISAAIPAIPAIQMVVSLMASTVYHRNRTLVGIRM